MCLGHQLLIYSEISYLSFLFLLPPLDIWRWPSKYAVRKTKTKQKRCGLLFHDESASFPLALPGQHQVCTGVVGPGARGAPLDGVDFFIVGLEVMNTRVLLHTPDLQADRRET